MPTLSDKLKLHSAEKAKYRRHNVLSVDGHAMLVSYKKGIQAMLDLPASDPRNWFRHAFIHFLDCPHGNWWFPVWHRVYLYWFEKIIRDLSKDPNFTLPYWDWSQYPEIPDSMFEGVLTPTHEEYRKYTKDIDTFTDFIKPDLSTYWSCMGSSQKDDMQKRGYRSFDDMWQAMLGYVDGKQDPQYEAFAQTDNARYLSIMNSTLDKKTKHNVSLPTIESALAPQLFYSLDPTLSFSSPETDSHVTPPMAPIFSILEGQPHNSVHNCIGGIGHAAPPYGNMAGFLSPVDPIFFLHHANIDRLWDVWARKQEKLGLEWGPRGPNEGARYFDEEFLFFFDEKKQPVAPIPIPFWYHDLKLLDYDYAPGTGESIIPTATRIDSNNSFLYEGIPNGNAASINIPSKYLDTRNGTQKPLVAAISFSRPEKDRSFDVLINAPHGTITVDTDSPYYAGTVAFFGPPMSGMAMSDKATFTITLPRTLKIFHTAYPGEFATLTFTIVPSVNTPGEQPLIIQSLTVRAL